MSNHLYIIQLETGINTRIENTQIIGVCDTENLPRVRAQLLRAIALVDDEAEISENEIRYTDGWGSTCKVLFRPIQMNELTLFDDGENHEQ